MYTWEFQNTRTGKWKYINDRAIKWLDGRIVRLEVSTDITEKVHAEKELIKAKKLESIGVLAGGIAHDFNNILVGVLGNIDLALNDDSLPDETRKLLKNAVKASYQARGLTRQLLTFAKGGEPVKETASLIEVVKESANFVLHGDKTACEFSFPDNLWLVDIDKGQISQVVQNIILNASSAMPEGGIVELSGENVGIVDDHEMLKKGRYVKISIKDHGIGIPADLIEKIFDPYFSTKKEGNGLGLAISHSIITKHGGHIAATSTPGQGATFVVFLPASANQKEIRERPAETEEKTKECRVLVMDDEEMVRDILKALLKRLGHDVILAENGREAIDTYQNALKSDQPIDLIIMDLTIPGGMGGKDAVHEILALDPKAKVVVSSGYSNDPIMANYRDYGFSAAIAKPYQMSELTNIINQLL
jgi:signal transduction histidine kinase/CheY-like chemotaxis protein